MKNMGRRKVKKLTMEQKLLGIDRLYGKKYLDLGNRGMFVTRVNDKFSFQEVSGGYLIKRGNDLRLSRLLEYIETGY